MMFNGVFLLFAGVVSCMEGVRGAASPQRAFGGSHHGGSGIRIRRHGIGGDCEWDKDKDFPQHPSLLIDKDSRTSILPVWSGTKRVVRIPSGSTVVIACPETIIKATRTDVTEGRCNGGHVLKVGGANYDMMDLGCESRLKESVQDRAVPCGVADGSRLRYIGYDVHGYYFYKLIEVCFHQFRENIFYAKHTLRGKSVKAPDLKGPRRPFFRKDPGFYTLPPNRCYKPTSQKETMDILHVDRNIIDPENGRYFAKGQLAPDADFPSKTEAHATYRYINAAPQWKPFNDGNWKNMEEAVRDLASSHGTDFKVWTGTWGTLELNGTNETPVPIYLGIYEEQEVLTVPKLMWKVVHDPSRNRGVGIIVDNRPDMTSLPEKLCNDISNQIKWINFDQNDLERGVTYCCTVAALRHLIPYAPDLGNAGLLTD